ncbi:MAG: formylglycine-generating enzyme family protein, partial [Chloroflexi bacterium]|nr:formylglycine-generating enzyme family protein [Chloroflexota bacterium]
MRRERGVMGKLCLLLLLLALIAGCSKPACTTEGDDMVLIPAGEFTMGNDA